MLLDAKKIKSALITPNLSLDILEKIDSTNEYLSAFINTSTEPRICLAEVQIQGRGRLHRQWYSPFGCNIYCSVLYSFDKDISELAGLSLVVGLALCRAIETTSAIKPSSLMVKWPNDVIAEQYKLAGTLIELHAKSNGACHVIIGVGINVNMTEASKNAISQPWTSIAKITGYKQDRNPLCAAVINKLMNYLTRFNHEGLSAFQAEWCTRDYLFHKPITLISHKIKEHGIGMGINKQGRLLLQTTDNSIKAYSSGDTTVGQI